MKACWLSFQLQLIYVEMRPMTKTHNYAVSQLLLTNVHRITDAVTKVSEAEKTEKYFTEYTVDD